MVNGAIPSTIPPPPRTGPSPFVELLPAIISALGLAAGNNTLGRLLVGGGQVGNTALQRGRDLRQQNAFLPQIGLQPQANLLTPGMLSALARQNAAKQKAEADIAEQRQFQEGLGQIKETGAIEPSKFATPEQLNAARLYAVFTREARNRQLLGEAGELMPQLADITMPANERRKVRGEIARRFAQAEKPEQARLIIEGGKLNFEAGFNRIFRQLYGRDRDPGSATGPEAAEVNRRILSERSEVRAAGAKVTAEENRRFLLDSPYVLAAGQNANLELVRDTQTGIPITGAEKYGDVVGGLERKSLIKIGTENNKVLNSMQLAIPLVKGIADKLERAYSSEGVLNATDPVTGRLTNAGQSLIARALQNDPEFVALARNINALPERFGRLTTGAVGVQTERDVERFKALLPVVTKIPDRKGVAFQMINELYDIIDRTQGAILRNPGFRTPGAKRLDVPQQQSLDVGETITLPSGFTVTREPDSK